MGVGVTGVAGMGEGAGQGGAPLGRERRHPPEVPQRWERERMRNSEPTQRSSAAAQQCSSVQQRIAATRSRPMR